MNDDAKLRCEIEECIRHLDSPKAVYELFHKMNYPKDKIFNTSYVRNIREFEFAKDEKEKINKIYTVMSYDRLNVFLIETKSLTRPFVRYITKIFSNMYDRFLLIFTIDFSIIQFVFPEYEKKEVGKHKLKTTVLEIKKDDIYYTDIYVLSNIFLKESAYSWRDIWRKWNDAFNVEKVTDKFFEDYKRIFFTIRMHLKRQNVNIKVAHEFTLQFLNRIMFIYFISKKGWLNQDYKFMKNFWENYKRTRQYENNEFYTNWLQPLFFEAFNNKSKFHSELPEEINRIFSNTPYLNGGLFKKKKGQDDLNIILSDSLFKQIFQFFESYNFTIKEDSAVDIEVSVDPQMIGYVYESLANVTEDLYEKEDDKRGDWGIFYTARVEVDFMCKRSLVEYLANNLDIPKDEIYEFVFDENKEKVEKKFNQRRCWRKIEDVLNALSIVDPACGSGAFLVGMLNALVELYKIIYSHTNKELDDFKIKYQIIQRSLYGVDVMPWAIHASELRLWLQLIVETDIKAETLREHPLLPNLSMNLRIGDSLVQEIGGIIFNVRGNNLKPHLKRKLNDLKQEKQKYFEGSFSKKFSSSEEIKHEEIMLFNDILDERSDNIKTENEQLKKSGKNEQTGLFGEVNPEAQNIQREQKKKAEIEEQIEKNEEHVVELERLKTALHDPEQKPFVWDIDFAEVFAEKGGFDIVIGNPPYVRQEIITPPNVLKEDITLADRRIYKQKLIDSVTSRYPNSIPKWTKKCDLYVYFYFHGLSLLNKDGVFCFITSNSWLDVDYGKVLQEFLLRYCNVIGIYDNQIKRSFEHADVNTIIALFSAPVIKKQKSLFDFGFTHNEHAKNAYDGLNKVAKFIMFKKPFEEIINSSNMILIEKSEEIIKTNDFRVYCKSQEDLLEEGWEYPEDFNPEKNSRFSKGNFVGDKWGGKYLRAPDIYFTILEKGKGKLVELGKIAKIRFGIKTGANEFFYLNKETQEKWNIEKEFLKPVIKSPRECKALLVNPSSLDYKILMCHKNKRSLEGSNVLDYINWGENAEVEIKQGVDKGKKIQGFQNISSIISRKLWYSLPQDFGGHIFIQMTFNDSFPFYYTEEESLVDARLYEIKTNNFNPKDLCLSLNSTLSVIFMELYGRANLGEGALDFKVYEADKILCLPKKNLSDSILTRKTRSIFEECGIDSTKPIREQEPNPLPDRVDLDKNIFNELGLTEEERKEFYWSVCELVKYRLDKASSLKKR